jgi:Skp family chaperone for outer membrane proteins
MMKYLVIGMLLSCFLLPLASLAQEDAGASTTDKLINFPSKFFSRIQGKTADLDKQLTTQTEKYLAKMAKREERLKKKLYKTDSTAAKNLFATSTQQYAALAQKMRQDTGSKGQSFSGEYQPYTDSLQGTLNFLQKNPQVLGASPVASTGGISSGLNKAGSALTANVVSPQLQAQLQSSSAQLQALQAKMQDADQVKAYIQQRKQQIGDYISQHASLAGILGKQYTGLKQDQLLYSQQVQQYRDMLNSPEAMEQKALSLLNQLPAFQTFMKNNSQLAGLFNLPGNYGSAQGLVGLQTRDQVNNLIQGQVAAGGSGGAAALQSNLESAQSQLDGYKDKLSQLGQGSGDIDMPDFKPKDDQKIKTFWKRLEYGTNFQTTRDNYYFPTVLDLGGSVGYKLNSVTTLGVGFSYKIGCGNGIQHIALSSNGVGLRSYLDIKIKGSFSLTAGLEYNYTTPFSSYQQLRQLNDWTKSGLIGVTKTVSVKSRVFTKTKISLLWDYLSYSQIPKTQAVVFRVGYAF